MKKKLVLAVIPILAALFLTAPQTNALQYGRRTVWDGIYSPAQAANGLALMGQCRNCHGADMSGGQAPALRGPKFMDYWREDTMDSMYELIKTSMPPRANNPMSDADALSLVAYLLQANDFPAGNTDLGIAGLPAIHIEEKSGPQPLPSFAVVQIVGCTAKGDGDNWTLVQSTDPIRVRNAGRATPDELKVAAAKTLGSLTFPLQNLAMAGIDGSSLQEGRRMLAKGVLIRQPNGDRIGINSMQEAAANCGQ
jgi:S-disulfanyl-L-cysteine oxidoreductase SoxD